MTILVELFFPGGTTAQYERLRTEAALGQDGSAAPEGMVIHAAVVTDGGLRLVQLWDSEQDFQSFFAQLDKAINEIGVPRPEPPTITAVHHVLVSGDAAAPVTPPALPLDFPIRHG